MQHFPANYLPILKPQSAIPHQLCDALMSITCCLSQMRNWMKYSHYMLVNCKATFMPKNLLSSSSLTIIFLLKYLSHHCKYTLPYKLSLSPIILWSSLSKTAILPKRIALSVKNNWLVRALAVALLTFFHNSKNDDWITGHWLYVVYISFIAWLSNLV